VTAWVSGLAGSASEPGRALRLAVGWALASVWLAGLFVAVTGLYVGRYGGHVWDGIRLRAELRSALRRHRSAIRGAERNLGRLEKTYSKDVAAAQKRLEGLQSPNGARLTTYRGVQLYELGIVTPSGTAQLEGARARAEAAGSVAVTQRATLTRMGAGALVAGPVGLVAAGVAGKKKKKHDFRELYLIIEAAGLSTVIKCNPNDGMKARNFVAKVNNAAAAAGGIRARRPQEIAAAAVLVSSSKSAIAPVEAARAELEHVRADPVFLAATEAARTRLAQVSGAARRSARTS